MILKLMGSNRAGLACHIHDPHASGVTDSQMPQKIIVTTISSMSYDALMRDELVGIHNPRLWENEEQAAKAGPLLKTLKITKSISDTCPPPIRNDIVRNDSEDDDEERKTKFENIMAVPRPSSPPFKGKTCRRSSSQGHSKCTTRSSSQSEKQGHSRGIETRLCSSLDVFEATPPSSLSPSTIFVYFTFDESTFLTLLTSPEAQASPQNPIVIILMIIKTTVNILVIITMIITSISNYINYLGLPPRER